MINKLKSNEVHITLWYIFLKTEHFTSSNFLALYCSAPFRKFSSMMSHNTVPYIIIVLITFIYKALNKARVWQMKFNDSAQQQPHISSKLTIHVLELNTVYSYASVMREHCWSNFVMYSSTVKGQIVLEIILKSEIKGRFGSIYQFWEKNAWCIMSFYTNCVKYTSKTHHSHWREGCHHVDECRDHVELPCL